MDVIVYIILVVINHYYVHEYIYLCFPPHGVQGAYTYYQKGTESGHIL